MRDPSRIPVVIEALWRAWEANPDWRLGQLIFNAARPTPPSPTLFYMEDDVLMRRLQDFVNH